MTSSRVSSVTLSDIMAELAVVRSTQNELMAIMKQVRLDLVMKNLSEITPRDVRRKKQIKHLKTLDEAIGLKTSWFRAGRISLMIKGDIPAPTGLEYVVRELRSIESTTSQSRIQQLINRN